MNKNDAAAAIGISVRSLQRDTQNGLIMGTYRDHKGKMVLDYSDKEVERWTKERRRVVPESVALVTKQNGLPDRQALTQWGDEFLARLVTGIKDAVDGSKKPNTVALQDKMVLSLPEAVKLSGIPRSRLKEALLPDGTVLCFRDDPRLGRGYKIRKMDLIEYVHALDLPELEQHEK